jgi:hypothetical protein
MVYINHARPAKKCPSSKHFSLCHAILYIPFTQNGPLTWTTPICARHHRSLSPSLCSGQQRRSPQRKTRQRRPDEVRSCVRGRLAGPVMRSMCGRMRATASPLISPTSGVSSRPRCAGRAMLPMALLLATHSPPPSSNPYGLPANALPVDRMQQPALLGLLPTVA